MKNLPKNRNIYIQKGRFYVDCQKDGVRIRRSTGLKKSPLAFNFVRNNYDRFIGSRAELEQAQRDYYKLEDAQVERRLRKGEEGAIKPVKNSSEYSFDSVIDKLLVEKSFLKDKTLKFYRTTSNFISEFLDFKGIYYLSDFERHHSVDFVQYCKNKGLKDSSIGIYCSFFKMLFRFAVSNDLILKSPFFMPRLKQKYEPKNDKFMPFCLDEILELIKNAGDGELRLFLVIAFFTGARTGEILALTFDDLNFNAREIRINKTISDMGIIDSPKTKSSNRTIDMLDIVYKELVKLKIKDGSERIFKLSHSMFRLKFNELQEKLGYNRRRLYDTRHSFASVMLSRGEEPMWVGCKMMGHKDLNETYRSYAKYLPKEVKQRAVFLNDIVI
ncbi:site-specific integrase [Campylobacter fetus subsp. venerealis]|nr:tyrosine-type recombinase/integrase [Campylobacter fetus]MBK3498195.1 site-specific integrase [Campylobacter fetus subsp. venerealis]MBK3502174.1 site-specific integrase [Campylobacter fetus subsp. venerealis]OCS16956.1 integrase [Campylobacter fetus subsp. venerealis]